MVELSIEPLQRILLRLREGLEAYRVSRKTQSSSTRLSGDSNSRMR